MLDVVFQRLWHAYGPQGWWPARTNVEVVVGAILTQNTAWSNVERAIERLRQAELLNWAGLRNHGEAELAELIRSSGTYQVKARRLKAFVNALWNEHAGSLERMLGGELDVARKRLLAIHGIGPETADAILLYAGRRPSFVVDAYTMRVLRRHGAIQAGATYEVVRALFQRQYASDIPVLDAEAPHEAAPKTWSTVELFNEYHALFVEVGKRHCRVRPRCEGCPLADLPHDSEA